MFWSITRSALELWAHTVLLMFTSLHLVTARGFLIIGQKSVACSNDHASVSAHLLGCATIHVDLISCTTVCVRLSTPSRASRSQLEQVHRLRPGAPNSGQFCVNVWTLPKTRFIFQHGYNCPALASEGNFVPLSKPTA